MLESSVIGETTPSRRAEPGSHLPPARSRSQPNDPARWTRDTPVRRRSARIGAARRAAKPASAVGRYLASNLDRARLWLAGGVAILGVLLAGSAGLADSYFHRGIETGGIDELVLHPTGRELATNADLTIIQPSQLDAVAEQLQIAGFRYVRQPFIWASIEPQQGVFDWSRYDAIVQALSERGITIVATLRGSPEWSRFPESRGQADAPPADLATFAAFATAFVEHYGPELIPFIQLWDRPNDPAFWGGAASTPSQYAALLTEASLAVERVRPAIQIALAEFEPFPTGGMADLDFLRGVYEADAVDAFDIVVATVDGGGRSPYDREIDADRLNLSRAILFREVMEDAGDTGTPVWAGRYGWASGVGERQVGPERQAAFVVDGIQRARTEWPWMGPMFMWGFLPLPAEAWAPYGLLTTDGKATVLFGAISRFAESDGAEAAPTGFVPVDASSLRYQGRWTSQDLPPQVYRTTAAVNDSVTIQFRGSGLIAFIRQTAEAGPVRLTLDGVEIGELSADSLQTLQALNVPIQLVDDIEYGVHELTLTLVGEGDLTIGGAEILKEQSSLWPVALLMVAALVAFFIALRDVAYLVARRTGHLRPQRNREVWGPGGGSMSMTPRFQR